MIIVAILALSGVVLALLFSVLQQLGPGDSGVFSYILAYMPYVTRGVKFVNGFCYANVVMPMLASILAAHGVYVVYKLYMWVVKKLPMFGVSD